MYSYIYVIVIYDMCALYFELFICHITCAMLICFAFMCLLRCKLMLIFISFEYIMLAWVI